MIVITDNTDDTNITTTMLVQFVRHHELKIKEELPEETEESLFEEIKEELPEEINEPLCMNTLSPIEIGSINVFAPEFFEYAAGDWQIHQLDYIAPSLFAERLDDTEFQVCYLQTTLDNARKIFFDLPLTKKEFRDELVIKSNAINFRPPERDQYKRIIPGRSGGREYRDTASTK